MVNSQTYIPEVTVSALQSEILITEVKWAILKARVLIFINSYMKYPFKEWYSKLTFFFLCLLLFLPSVLHFLLLCLLELSSQLL